MMSKQRLAPKRYYRAEPPSEAWCGRTPAERRDAW